MSIYRITYQEDLNSPDKVYEFDTELDAQEFLDQLPSRVGGEMAPPDFVAEGEVALSGRG